jgi:Flp pilus assembly protein TadB
VSQTREREEHTWGDGARASLARSIRRRRESAVVVHRRRLALLDVALGAAIGVLLLLLGLGLAPLGIVAVLVLAVCGVSYALGRRRRPRS